MDKLLIINKMKYLLFYALLLIAAMSYGQGLLPEEKTTPTTNQKKNYKIDGEFSEGLVRISLEWYPAYGFADRSNKIVIPIKYNNAGDFKEGLVWVKLNEKYGFINKQGKTVIPFKYDDAWDFSEGLALVKLNDKWGFIDRADKEVIAIKYDVARKFSEGLALVKSNGKYGFIDKTGKEVIAIKYDAAMKFSEGLAFVGLNGKWFYINRKGECVKNCDNAPADHLRAK